MWFPFSSAQGQCAGDERVGVGGRCEVDLPVTEPAESFPAADKRIPVCAWRVGTRYVAASQTGHHHWMPEGGCRRAVCRGGSNQDMTEQLLHVADRAERAEYAMRIH